MNIDVLEKNKVVSSIDITSESVHMPVKYVPYFIKTNHKRDEYEYVYNVLDEGKIQEIIDPECTIAISKKPCRIRKVTISDNNINAKDVANVLIKNNIDAEKHEQLLAGLFILQQLLENKNRVQENPA